MSITFEPDAVTIDSEDDDGDSDIYDEAQVIHWHISLDLLRVFKITMTTVIFKHYGNLMSIKICRLCRFGNHLECAVFFLLFLFTFILLYLFVD